VSKTEFDRRLKHLVAEQETLLGRKNEVDERWNNGVFERFKDPVLTAAHTPLFWRYDLDRKRNPHLLERLAVNAVFNPGAIEIDGMVYLVCRVEGGDRKSFFAVAESKSGTGRFRFWDRPACSTTCRTRRRTPCVHAAAWSNAWR